MADATTLESMTKPPVGVQSLKAANPNDSLFRQGIDYTDPLAVAAETEALAQGLEKHAESMVSGHGQHSNPDFLLRKAADMSRKCAAFVRELLANRHKPVEKKSEDKK